MEAAESSNNEERYEENPDSDVHRTSSGLKLSYQARHFATVTIR